MMLHAHKHTTQLFILLYIFKSNVQMSNYDKLCKYKINYCIIQLFNCQSQTALKMLCLFLPLPLKLQ